jgi:NAD(P)-dependent dehydrogenase (short-subunit alcohol dehydrogenase family)
MKAAHHQHHLDLGAPADQGLGVSNTIRGAMASWAKTLAVELESFGITVNNVLPGSTKTGRLAAVFEGRAQIRGVRGPSFQAICLRSCASQIRRSSRCMLRPNCRRCATMTDDTPNPRDLEIVRAACFNRLLKSSIYDAR